MTGKRCERGRSLSEPEREPERAAFVAVKAAITKRNEKAKTRSRAARQSRATCALCAQEKAGQFAEKQVNLFYRKLPCFFDARELGGRPKPNWRKQAWFTLRAASPTGFFAAMLRLSAKGTHGVMKHG
ncbi:MAG: hypothetical protein IJ214_06870, partial [Clostridia bacterium]|nr:hypothetical protein [Clostridia bacterium]